MCRFLFTFQDGLIDYGEFSNFQKPQVNKKRQIVSIGELYIRYYRLPFSLNLPDGLDGFHCLHFRKNR